MSEQNYPECDKLVAISDKSQEIGQFIEWLSSEKKIYLGHHVTFEDVDYPRNNDTSFVPLVYSMEQLLAEYFNIDLTKVEAERRDMLKRMSAS